MPRMLILRVGAVAAAILVVVALGAAKRYEAVGIREYDSQSVVFVLDRLTGSVCANVFSRTGGETPNKNFQVCSD